HFVLLPNGGAGRSRRDKPLFYPAVAHPAGVGGVPHIHPRAGPGGAVAAHHIGVLLPFKVGQLVEPVEVERFALIIGPALGVLHRAEVALRPAGEYPYMARRVVLSPRERPAVVVHALVHQVAQLGERLAQDQRPVVRDVHLPQRFDHQRVAFSAARRAPVQGFRLGPLHKGPLPRLGLPDHRRLSVHGVSSFPSWTGGSSTTPHSLPALPPPCSPKLLATAARSLSTAVISFSAFMSPAPSARL